jgi:hypothetical protein
MDDPDDLDGFGDPLPFASHDAAITGAAAEAADEDDGRVAGLPRLLRYALLVHDHADLIEQRLMAEIAELCPGLPGMAAWAMALDGTDERQTAGLALAAELDRLAVLRDLPVLRSLSDCVRMLALTVPCDARRFEEFRRVAQALSMTFIERAPTLDDQRRVDLERAVAGWAALPLASDVPTARRRPAITAAARLGDQFATHRIRITATAQRMRRQFEDEKESLHEFAGLTPSATQANAAPASAQPQAITPLPSHHVTIGRMEEAEIRSPKLKGIIEPVRAILNTALPLTETPPLDRIRTALIAEFPYAADAIDAVLTGLIGKPIIRLRPTLLVGEPGAGKSRFARRLGEVLGLATWRVDAAQADGSVLGGTDRRWHSAECCHPLLAIARGRIANPLILIDEIEKAATRTDYGRLWDCLLGLIELETSCRYPDPALQIPLDLSHVNYIATANSIAPLPAPLRDRFRIIPFREPTIDDLDALLPGLIHTLAAERGLDARWFTLIDPIERAAIAKAWPGGSIRKLQRILETILQARDRSSPRQ